MGAGRACSDAVHRDAIKAGLERHVLRVLSNTRQRPGQWDPFGRLDRSPDLGPSATRSPGPVAWSRSVVDPVARVPAAWIPVAWDPVAWDPVRRQ